MAEPTKPKKLVLYSSLAGVGITGSLLMANWADVYRLAINALIFICGCVMLYLCYRDARKITVKHITDKYLIESLTRDIAKLKEGKNGN